MKIFSWFLVFPSVLLWNSFTWAEPYTYGHFNGSYNVSEPQSVYGDFDGDGRLDHVISRPETELLYVYMDSSNDKFFNLDRINSARVSMYSDIYPGSGTTYWDHELTPNDLDPTITSDTRIGSSLASGDFDGDGDDELVIGLPFATVGGRIYAGKVIIIDGGTSFPNRSKTVLYQGASDTFGTVWGRAEYADGFGDVLAVGDYDGNGIDDLAIGTPAEDMGRVLDVGVVILLYGYLGSGLYTNNYRLRQNDINGESETRKEYFGAALAAGRFNDERYLGNRCASLAVGAPGEDISGRNKSGAAYVFLARAGSRLLPSRCQKLHQNVGRIASIPETNDQFGATLGVITSKLMFQDGLWIGAINESYAGKVTEPEHTFYHRLYSNGTQINTDNDRYYGGMFSPGVLEDKQQISEVNTKYGSIAFYVPDSVYGATVLVHGTNAGPADTYNCTPITMKYAGNNGVWLRYVDLFNLALIVPTVDNNNFGNYSVCAEHGTGEDYWMEGGYRGLFGGVIRPSGEAWGFDDWLNFIMDELTKIDSDFGKPFYLHGHSAGAQFVTRYLWAHPERVQSAVIESGWSHLSPDDPTDGLPAEDWPMGMDAYSENQYWPGWAGVTRVDYDPAWDHGVGGDIDSRWTEVLQKHIHVIVGEDDDGGSGDRCRRLNVAHTWVELVNSLYSGLPGTNDVTICYVDNADHDSDNTELREESALRLFLNLSAGHCVTPARSCLDWTP